MPRRTPQYLLDFFIGGDIYSAQSDLDRMTIIDNQLYGLSRLVGDGVLSGWTISSAGGLSIEVSPGSGFIENVLHVTLTEKDADLVDDAVQSVLLSSNFLSTSEGFKVEVEGPFSSTVSATYVDSTAPGIPTGFSGTSPDFDLINLFWDANSEVDFDHYEIQRDTVAGFTSPVTVTDDLDTNGVFPSAPFQDTGLDSETDYYYRIRAVDKSGNASGYSTIGAITTLADINEPGEPTSLRLFPGNGSISLAFDPSPTSDVTKYIITVQVLAPNGTVASTLPEIDNGLVETAQVTGLTNGVIHRVRVQSVRMPGTTEIRSPGIVSEAAPFLGSAPLAPTGLLATPGVGTVALAWTASASASGSAVGQKDAYYIRVVPPGEADSAPRDVGLAVSKTINGFDEAAAVGTGPTRFFEDDVVYLFKVTTVDAFGNESAPALVKASTSDSTPPKNPRSLFATPGDTTALLSWRHSQSEDVVDYELEIDTGSGFGAPISVGYVERYLVTGLPNNTNVTLRMKAVDDAGNLSSGSSVVTVPVPDTIPPDVVTNVKASPGDEHVRLTWATVPNDDLDHFVVERSEVLQTISTNPNFDLTIVAGSTVQFDVGKSVAFIDIGLTNGRTYQYTIQSVDVVGNESEPSAVVLVSPSQGLNVAPDRIEAPSGVTASFVAPDITVAWDFDDFGAMFLSGEWVFTTNPSAAPTAFNIYRSTNSVVGFELVDSVPASVREYVDTNLISGSTYYYRVTAVRDNADIIVNTGSVQPPNTVFLGTVTTSGGSITSIENAPRIAKDIESTLTEETLRRLLEHRHSVRPLNEVETVALSSLGLIDINDVPDEISTTQPDTVAYYQGVNKDPSTGEVVTFDSGTIYIFNPTFIEGRLPFIGDFQVLVNGERPSGEFTIDEDKNAIVFSEGLADTDTVTADGLGQTYYVPTQMRFNEFGEDFQGYEVRVDGSLNSSALVDDLLQTIRFITPLDTSLEVTLVMDPAAPDFGTQEGARLVHLGSKDFLADFVRVNDRTFVSESGNFSEDDTVFVQEINSDGTIVSRTTRTHFIDFDSKAIVFDEAVPLGTDVGLRLRNREEVQGSLPVDKLGDLDASVVRTGNLIVPQLPENLSHEGRVHEQAFPVFVSAAGANGYVFSAPVGAIGGATTVYAIQQTRRGESIGFLLGTSRGLLRSVRGVFLGADDTADIAEALAGTEFGDISGIVSSAQEAVKTSGRIAGTINVINAGDLAPVFSVKNPNMVEMDDGRILLLGGEPTGAFAHASGASNQAWLFDPGTSVWTQTDDLPTRLRDMATVRLPNGNILSCGGQRKETILGNTPFVSKNSTYIYSKTLGTWSQVGDMSQDRAYHAAVVLDPADSLSDVLAAGGQSFGFDVSELEQTEDDLRSAERFDQSGAAWGLTGSLNIAAPTQQISTDNGNAILDTFKNRELYDSTAETWTLTAAVLKKQSQLEFGEVDGPIKQFFEDSTGALLAVTRNNVYESRDNGVNFAEMRGLDTVGVVHRVSEIGGTLFAATDLGVYVMDSANRDISTWFQGGLLGAGTTETFDLLPFGAYMLAATEIGIFSSDDDGDTWVELVSLDDVFNVEQLGDDLFAQAGQDVYRSEDAGANWERISTLSFLDSNSKLVSREPGELFFGTAQGLFRSLDGISFGLVSFDHNKDARRNNVHMLEIEGGDLFVGYDNVVFSVGPDLETIRVSEFTGAIPTVRVNGEEVRTGFRYDPSSNSVIFEIKRLSGDSVEVTSNYSLYRLSGGGWYAQNPSAPVRVFVDRREQDSEDLTTDARLGEIAFLSPLEKFQVVTVSVAGTTLRNEGELFHRELEDKLEKEKGLPLSLGRNYVADLLQLGLSIEHNFWERGIDRNQYYCLTGSLADRSFNSFWLNSEFYILGRRDFDSFNSTIEYGAESSQPDIGSQALVPLCSLEVSSTELWVGTDNGIFVLNPSSGFTVSKQIPISDDRVAVRDLQFFLDDVYAATDKGLYSITTDTNSVTRNAGNNLPSSVFSIASLNNVLVVGTNLAIYFTDSTTSENDDPFSVWFSGGYTDEDGNDIELELSGQTVSQVLVREGLFFAAAGRSLLTSTDGASWRRVFQFSEASGISINRMAVFSELLFLGTNKGVYNDRGTARSEDVNFELEPLETEEEDSAALYVNDMFQGAETLYVATDSSSLYTRTSESWAKQTVPPVSVHEVIETSGGSVVIMTNNQVFVE